MLRISSLLKRLLPTMAMLATVPQGWSAEPIDLADLPLDGPRAVAAVEPLRAELVAGSTPGKRRQQIAFTLARIGPEASAAVEDLERIANTEPDNRRWALKALATFGVEAAPAVPSLLEIASNRSLSIDLRLLATEAMANAAARRPAAVRWFYETLNNATLTEAEQRAFVSMSRVLGPIGGPVTPALLKHLEADDFQTRFLAAESLGFIGSPIAIEPLMIAALNNADPIVADAAAISINQLAGPIETAFQTLIEIGDAAVRIRVATAWKRPSNTRTQTLRSLLTDESEAVQVTVAYELLSSDRPAAMKTLKRLSAGRSRAAREARKTLRGIAIGRAEPPACRPDINSP